MFDDLDALENKSVKRGEGGSRGEAGSSVNKNENEDFPFSKHRNNRWSLMSDSLPTDNNELQSNRFVPHPFDELPIINEKLTQPYYYLTRWLQMAFAFHDPNYSDDQVVLLTNETIFLKRRIAYLMSRLRTKEEELESTKSQLQAALQIITKDSNGGVDAKKKPSARLMTIPKTIIDSTSKKLMEMGFSAPAITTTIEELKVKYLQTCSIANMSEESFFSDCVSKLLDSFLADSNQGTVNRERGVTTNPSRSTAVRNTILSPVFGKGRNAPPSLANGGWFDNDIDLVMDNQSNGSQVVGPESLSQVKYDDFIARLSHSDSKEVATYANQFVKSALDSSIHHEKPLQERWRETFDHLEEMMDAHPCWNDSEGDAAQHEQLMLDSREALEEYLCSRIKIVAFAPSAEERREDSRLWRRTRLLQFIEPPHLDILPGNVDMAVLESAATHLRQITTFKTPGGMISCIVKCATVIFDFLSSGKSHAGADDFLPLFIYTVLKAKVPQLLCCCEYIARYRHPRVCIVLTFPFLSL